MDDSVLDTIGSPLVRVRSPDGATVAAKLEWFNPGGSAKDRPALSMVRAAEQAGVLSPGDRVVEPTSGNTGIGLALVCAARGYDLTVVLPASKSPERRALIRAYGADVELVDGGMTDARERAEELEAEGAVLLEQFRNEANPQAHYVGTAEEIIEQVGSREIDAFVASVGTGGTIIGVGTRLKEAFPDIEIIGVEPARNPILSTGEPGKDEYQGMGPGFVSEILDLDLLDDVEAVALEDAEAEARRLAREEGILVGQSSGAASVASYRVAQRIAQPELDCPPVPSANGLAQIESDGGAESGYDDCPLVVTLFPDNGERYLSTGMFEADDATQ